MQDTSGITNWDAIIAGEHTFEVRLQVYQRSGSLIGTVNESSLFSISTNIEMFADTPEVGKAVAGEIDVEMLMPSFDIPKMARLLPSVRVKNATLTSGWLRQGTYYIDTRQVTQNKDGLNILTIHGFDAMLIAEQDWYDKNNLNWSTGTVSDKQMVAEIASIMGVSVDSRTTALMNKGYRVPMPTAYSCREVLSYIAGMYAGCFIMTEQGKLRLVTLTELPAETNLLITNVGERIVFGSDRIII